MRSRIAVQPTGRGQAFYLLISLSCLGNFVSFTSAFPSLLIQTVKQTITLRVPGHPDHFGRKFMNNRAFLPELLQTGVMESCPTAIPSAVYVFSKSVITGLEKSSVVTFQAFEIFA